MVLDWFVHYKRFGRFKRAFESAPLPVRPLSTFPKVIHLYWDQGVQHAPDLVRLCLESWRERNPGWELRLWDGESVESVVPRSDLPQGLKITPYSDILRTELLRRFGGVWADATILCNHPLDGWIPQIMAQTDFFAFSRPGPDRAIASWFLASRPQAPLIATLAQTVARFWSKRQSPTRSYHWFQYIFEYCARTSIRFRRDWDTAPKISAVPMLMLQRDLVSGRAPDDESMQLFRAVAMHKLTHKHPIDLDQLKRLVGGA